MSDCMEKGLEACLAALTKDPLNTTLLTQLRFHPDHHDNQFTSLTMLRCMEVLGQALRGREQAGLAAIALTRLFTRHGREAMPYLGYLFTVKHSLPSAQAPALAVLEAFKAIVRSTGKIPPNRRLKPGPFTSLAETIEEAMAAIEQACVEALRRGFGASPVGVSADEVSLECIWTLELISRHYRPVGFFEAAYLEHNDERIAVAALHLASHQPYRELDCDSFVARGPLIAAALFKYLAAHRQPAISAYLQAPWVTVEMATAAAETAGPEALLRLVRLRGVEYVAALEPIATQLMPHLDCNLVAIILENPLGLRVLFRMLSSSGGGGGGGGRPGEQLARWIWEQLPCRDLANPFGSGLVVKLAEIIEIDTFELGQAFYANHDEIVKANGLLLLSAQQEIVMAALGSNSLSDRLLWAAIHACRRQGWVDLIPHIMPLIREVKPLKELLGMISEHPEVDRNLIINWRLEDGRLQAILADFQAKLKPTP